MSQPARAGATAPGGDGGWVKAPWTGVCSADQALCILVNDLDETVLHALAERLVPILLGKLERQTVEPDRWLDTADAAAYLGLSVNALRKRTAARSIPFEQDAPGGKCWFRRADLDNWRHGGQVQGPSR